MTNLSSARNHRCTSRVALLAAVPSLRARFFTPEEVVHGESGSVSSVIGRTQELNGVRDVASLLSTLNEGFTNGVAVSHSEREHVVIDLQLREDNLTDIRLTCLMLRALWELSNTECMGIVLSRDPGEDDPRESSNLADSADEIRGTLSELGLAHVPVYAPAGEGTTSSEGLRVVYELAPPIGVTLIVASCATGVAAFAEQNPLLFREKTKQIIHMGGAFIESDANGRPKLTPDPAAQNNRLDMASASLLYERAQKVSVPLKILSRHVAHACRMPRGLFDVLLELCGPFGATLGQELRDSMQALWQRACAAPDDEKTRRNLPTRCDRRWFESTFCAGVKVENDTNVWPR